MVPTSYSLALKPMLVRTHFMTRRDFIRFLQRSFRGGTSAKNPETSSKDKRPIQFGSRSSSIAAATGTRIHWQSPR